MSREPRTSRGASAAGAGIGEDLNDMEMRSYNNDGNAPSASSPRGSTRRSLAARLSQSADRASYQNPDSARRSVTHHNDDDGNDHSHDEGDDDEDDGGNGNARSSIPRRPSYRRATSPGSRPSARPQSHHDHHDDDDDDDDLPQHPPISASPPVVALPGEKIKWDKITIDDALQRLEATRDGLSQTQFERRFAKFGPNKLPEVHHNPLLVFLSFMWNPLSWAMEAAAILALGLFDFPDFALILGLLILNACIGFFEEKSAGDAVSALMGQLAPQCKVKRDGEWRNLPASDLVPGDVIRIRLGDVVPADVKLLEGDAVKIDQSSLTGESLPVTKNAGAEAYSGSIVKQGEIEAVVHSTGVNTFFGQAANLISQTESVGHLQIVLTTVGNFCLFSILIWVIIELGVQFGYRDNPCQSPPSGADSGYCPTLSNLLVIIVGGIPVAMPTVLSVTMALGATQLAKKDAIVTRLTAIEELAGMDILCSDKTGTLTLNELSVDLDSMYPTHGHSKEDILINAALSARVENNEAIDVCVHEAAIEAIKKRKGSVHQQRASSASENSQLLWKDYELVHYSPFDPVSKRTIATIRDKTTGKVFRACKGAPQVILNMDEKKSEIAQIITQSISDFAGRGFRTLGVARSEGDVPIDEAKWEMIGLIPLFDPPRIDSGRTIERAKAMGVGVKMVTGDQLAIAKETARQLGIPDDIHTTAFFNQALPSGVVSIDELVESADGFAEVFPEHKYDIVKRLQDRGHIVGMTGDGVNDAPALKKADIGIAVADATDAARSAADIVLLSPGLSVIIDALIGSRKIFQRMKNYSIYSIAMTIRIVFTFGLLTTVYDWYFPTIIIVILAILNDGTVMTISKDRVKPSETPDNWNLKEIFIISTVIGLWLTISTLVLFHVAYRSDFFVTKYGLSSLQQVNVYGGCGGLLPYEIENYRNVLSATNSMYVYANSYNYNADYIDTSTDPALNTNPLFFTVNNASSNGNWSTSTYFPGTYYLLSNVNGICNTVEQCQQYAACGLGVMHDEMIRGLIYIQVSITGQATIFVTRAKRFSWMERPANVLMIAFAFAQFIATLIGVYGFGGYPDARDGFRGCGWGYALVAWIWSLLWFLPLDLLKLATKYFLTHRVSALYSRVAFFTNINAGHPTGRHLGKPKKSKYITESSI